MAQYRTYMARAWLKKDAINRAMRTLYQAFGATVLAGLADVGYQLLDRLVSATVSGAVIDWGETWSWTWHAALVTAAMPVLAYLHRKKLDPSAVPSLTPPSPPNAPTPKEA